VLPRTCRGGSTIASTIAALLTFLVLATALLTIIVALTLAFLALVVATAFAFLALAGLTFLTLTALRAVVRIGVCHDDFLPPTELSELHHALGLITSS